MDICPLYRGRCHGGPCELPGPVTGLFCVDGEVVLSLRLGRVESYQAAQPSPAPTRRPLPLLDPRPAVVH